jgi:hypothetical protein
MTARILASLGVSLVSLAGLTAAFDALKGQVIANIGGLPAAAIQLGGLFGIWQSFGLVLGAVLFVLTWNNAGGVVKWIKAT